MMTVIHNGSALRVGTIWNMPITARREAGAKLYATLPELFSCAQYPRKDRHTIRTLLAGGYVQHIGAGMYKKVRPCENKYEQACATVKGLGIVSRGIVTDGMIRRMIKEGKIEALNTYPKTWRWL